MIELTSEQHQSLASNGKGPVRVVDPATKAEYVLLRTEVYDRIKSILPDDPDWQETTYTSAMEVFAREGWDDPRMDVYDALDPRKNS
jgi:hypothetical protein